MDTTRRSGGAVRCRADGSDLRCAVARPAAFALILLLTLMPAGPAWAQTVQGTVLDIQSGLPIYTAEVALLAADDRVVVWVVTDEAGRFDIQAPDVGSYQLRASRIGYAALSTDTFTIEPGQDALLELRLQPSPIPMDSLEAVVEGQKPRRLVRVGFYERQRKGFGHFLAPEDIEARRPTFPTDLFWGMSGVRVIRRNSYDWDLIMPSAQGSLGGSRCHPSVSIDGMVVQAGGRDDGWQDLFHVNDIEAIEVYPRGAGLPGWMAGQVSPCGAILLWTKGSLR